MPNTFVNYQSSLTEHRTPDILAKLRAAEKANIQAEKEGYVDPQRKMPQARKDQKKKGGKKNTEEKSHQQESDWLESDEYEIYEPETDKYKGYGLERDQLESDRLESWSDQLDSDCFEGDENESDENDENESHENENNQQESNQKEMQQPDLARWRKKIAAKASRTAGNKRGRELNRITAPTNVPEEYTSTKPMKVLDVLLQQIALHDAEKYPECLEDPVAISSKMRELLRPEALAVFEVGDYSLEQ